ncbi:MAG: purine-nucleoside phosphorylase [Armatimonadetes bacterium]|nr:purine-nucleoside phosphorylase [Armatimonadota bacterium]
MLFDKIKEAANFIQNKFKIKPKIGLILGSGLGDLAESIQDKVVIPYKEIPHFPSSTVKGHAGLLVFGNLEEKLVLVFNGRIHYYEGYSMVDATFPVRLIKALGAEYFIVTNSCGGINPKFSPGDLMLITDHINLMGDNPLRGAHDSNLGERFPDMSCAYSPELIKLAKDVSKKEGILLKEGVYVGVSGPNYETLAEIKFIEKIGADAVGMSTVPEVIVAAQAKLKTLGISCITDVVFNFHKSGISHEEVLEVAKQTTPRFIKLVKALIRSLK